MDYYYRIFALDMITFKTKNYSWKHKRDNGAVKKMLYIYELLR